MSFFQRFIKIIPTSGVIKPSPIKPVSPRVVKQVVKPTRSVIEARTKARELIVEAKDQAFQIKRQADNEAQKIIQQSHLLKDQASKNMAEVDRRLGAIEQREKKRC